MYLIYPLNDKFDSDNIFDSENIFDEDENSEGDVTVYLCSTIV